VTVTYHLLADDGTWDTEVGQEEVARDRSGRLLAYDPAFGTPIACTVVRMAPVPDAVRSTARSFAGVVKRTADAVRHRKRRRRQQ
jgi:hypothetical protein